MIAICPAGPPKLIQPSLIQKRSASPKVGMGGGVIVTLGGINDAM